MDVDAKGRVWVTEGWNYRASRLRPKEGDRIMILEDTDGDGKADKATTFYQGTDINSALGICVLGNKVIVSCAPNVFLFTDEDGDGKADKKELLFTGIKGEQHDHAIHAFNFGPDGKLYFNYGNAGEQLMDKDGKPITDVAGNVVNAKGNPYRQGMVFRMNMDGSELEVARPQLPQQLRGRRRLLRHLWQSDNDDDGNRGVRINYVMEFGNFGYTDELTGAGWQDAWRKAQSRGASENEKVQSEWHQYDPGVVPNLLNTGAGSPTGICVYEGKLLPKEFQGQVIHCDAGPNVVRAYPVQADGAGYKAEIVNILQGGSDKWFRPADVCVAPDGSLMVADWYDPRRRRARDGGQDDAEHQGPRLPCRPAGREVRDSEARPDYRRRRCSRAGQPEQRHSLPRLDQAPRPRPSRRARNCSSSGKTARSHGLRARALHLLARIKGSDEKYLKEALSDQDADIRITAIRLARELKHPELMAWLGALARDTSPQVRREIAIALRHNKSDRAPKIWAELASQHDGRDRWYLEALGIGADGQEDAFFDALIAKIGAENMVNTPAGREVVWRSRAQKSRPLLAKSPAGQADAARAALVVPARLRLHQGRREAGAVAGRPERRERK
jgi:putative membrane-bound dehydrogenase-like protein